MHLMALKKKCFCFLALLILISCSSNGSRQNIENAPYRSSGVEQFFLTELPGWNNSSPYGRCFKSNSFQYLDFAKLNGTYQLSYREMIELQGQYNQKREDYFRSTAYRFLKPVEEASFFANTLEQVRGGVRHFNIPQVPEVDVIWLEGFLQEKRGLQLLSQLAAAGRFEERLPILFSSCLSNQRLVQWVTENGLEQVGFYLLSAEWLTPYGSDNLLKAGLQIEIKEILHPNVKVRVLTPNKKISTDELVL